MCGAACGWRMPCCQVGFWLLPWHRLRCGHHSNDSTEASFHTVFHVAVRAFSMASMRNLRALLWADWLKNGVYSVDAASSFVAVHLCTHHIGHDMAHIQWWVVEDLTHLQVSQQLLVQTIDAGFYSLPCNKSLTSQHLSDAERDHVNERLRLWP